MSVHSCSYPHSYSCCRPGLLRVVSPPGQPHISQARQGELVEVGEGGQVQEDVEGQVSLTCSSLGGRPAADLEWRHGDGSLVEGELLDLVTLVDSGAEDAAVFRTVSTLRILPARQETIECVATSEAFPRQRVSILIIIFLHFLLIVILIIMFRCLGPSSCV